MFSAAPAAERDELSARSFDLRVRPHLAAAHTLARRILRCADGAEDAVQEALLALWAHHEEPRDLRAWLLRAVRHRALHQRRTALRRMRREREVAVLDIHADDPLRCAICREHADEIERALASVPETLRHLLADRAEDATAYAHLAARWGVPVGTVRSRLSRARATLRKRLLA